VDKGDYFNTPKVDLDTISFTEELLMCLPKELANRYSVLPVASDELTITIAMVDPSDLDAIDALHFLLKRDIEPRIADEDQLQSYLQKFYRTNNNDIL
jgi:type IV pilus assembly protein PilB